MLIDLLRKTDIIHKEIDNIVSNFGLKSLYMPETKILDIEKLI